MADSLSHPLVALVAISLIVAAACVVCIALKYGRRIDAKVAGIHFELRPNGGSSTKDQINRIETKVDAIDERVRRLENPKG